MRRALARLAPLRLSAVLWRYAPAAALVLTALAIGVAVYLETNDVAGVGGFCQDDAPGTCGMAGNVLVAFLAAAVAYAILRGWKSRRALRLYVDTAIKTPRKLVRWAPRFQAEVSSIRDGVARDIVGVVTRRGPARVVVLHGRNGAGKTGLLLRLTKELPSANPLVLPLPVSLRRAESLDAIGPLTRRTFIESVDSAVDSDGDADLIWRWARRTRRFVVLLDDLDDCPAMHPHTKEARDNLEEAIEEMQRAHISVVLATSSDIHFTDLPAMHFALDAVDRDAAHAYIAKRVGDGNGGVPKRVEDAIAAIGRASGELSTTALCDVRRIAALETAGELPDDLPPIPDVGRAELLDRWLAALRSNRLDADWLCLTAADELLEVTRREAAIAYAQDVAKRMLEARSTAPVDRDGDDRRAAQAADDAVALALLFSDRGRLGFASRELQAMFIALNCEEAEVLQQAVEATVDPHVPRDSDPWIEATVAWAARHRDGDPRLPADLLTSAEESAHRGVAIPRLVGCAARVVLVCGRTDLFPRVAEAAVQLDPQHADAAACRSVVDSCARFGGAEATKVLWHFAQAGDVLVEWEAANALLNADEGVLAEVTKEARRMLSRAREKAAPLDDWRSDLSHRIGSLAWVTPSWRDAELVSANLFDSATEVCLRMSPLQGEVALARGLKLAATRGEGSSRSVTAAEDMLLGDRRPKTWIARMLMVQAVTIHAVHSGNGAVDKLRRVQRQDPHPLVREAAAIGVMAATGSAGDVAPEQVVWRTERDAVAGVRHGAGRMSRLAGDAVLLCNVIYDRAHDDQAGAERLATATELPRCLGRPLERCADECDCGFRLCDGDVRKRAVQRPRAPLTAAFCLECERHARWLGPPPWDGRPRPGRGRQRRQYWHELAGIASG